MAWSYPHEFHDGTGETASGVQVNDNFAKAREKIEAAEALTRLIGATYTARTSSTINADHVVSGSQPAVVVLSIQSPISPPTIEAFVLVGGKEVAKIAEVGQEGNRWWNVTILVPPGAAWRVNSSASFTVDESHMLF